MEQLLFLLFLLFSVGSAILERRKRAKQLEEAQKRADERRQRQTEDGQAPAPVALDEDDDEEEEWGGWPFPGGDPFERPRPRTEPARPQRAADPAPDPVEEPAPVHDVRSLLEEIERRSHQAEVRAREEEERAMRRAEEARRAAVPARPIAELMQQKLQQSMPPQRSAGSRRRRRTWRLTPSSARQAVVYAEILGPCKAVSGDGQERFSG